jgi:hypothetical protein
MAGPLDILKDYKSTNPEGFAVLLGGIASFAAVAIVIGFGIDLQAQTPAVMYVLGVGVLVTVIAAIVRDVRLMAVLKWFATLLVIIWVVAFGLTRLIGNEILSRSGWQLQCIVEFWRPCVIVSDRQAEEDNLAPPVEPAPPPEIDPAISPGDYKVFVQFAGIIKRDDVRIVMKQLAATGWNVQGVDGGGERTAAAAGYAEVRAASSDIAAAKVLAEAVHAFKLTPRSISAKEVAGVPPGTLEVWVSN